jgi:asparagine synthase (glutamine-hydrolysing)
MCGITGIINYNENLLNSREKIHRMTDTLINRGPDEYGFYYKENVLLGHRRLVVIDPEGGKQPMTVNTGHFEYTIVYNGELYNTNDIRNDLIKKGYTFNSHSDTEVVLKSYIEWGEDCVQYMNGIFAFGIWESLTKSLFLARDRVGVKPLFYSKNNNTFLFGSEIKAILASNDINPIFDNNSLLELFSLGPSRVLGSGLFKNIYEVKPGELMYITPHKVFKKIYWKPITKDHTENVSSTIEHVEFLVKDAIQRQLISDVPICTFLSGGLDSSGISSVASKYLQETKNSILTTYSIDYEDNDLYFTGDSFQPSNDNMWVNRVSDYIKSQHNRVEIGISELAESLMNATLATDYPGMADIDSSLLLFCNRVKNKHTVALSGECADEIFGGYPWYRKEEDVNYAGFPWIKHMDIRKSFLSKEIEHLDLEGFASEQYKKTINEIEFLEHESDYEKNIRKLTYLNYKWFMVTLLTRKDRMSMFSSLEVRVPYADHRIMEYVYNIPWNIKYMDNIEKGLLRKALYKHLPKDVVERKKSPYPKTYNPKYTNILCGLLKDIMSKNDAPIKYLINEEKINSILNSDVSMFSTPWFGQLMKGPQFIAYLIQLNYFLETYKVKIEI